MPLQSLKIQKLAESDPEFSIILKALKDRKRNRKVTDIRQFEYRLWDQGFPIPTAKILLAFKLLEKAEAGSLIYGRRGNPNRFKWLYSIKKIGEVAFPNEIEKSQKPVLKVLSEKKLSEYIPTNLRNSSLQIRFQAQLKLNKNRNVGLDIPSDITKEEVEKIYQKLLSLVP